MGDLLRLPIRRFSTCAGTPAASVADSALAAVDISTAVREVQALIDLSDERLEALPYKSPAWSRELERWLGLHDERATLEDWRGVARSGMRVLEGGKR